jgi:hypothetical protein
MKRTLLIAEMALLSLVALPMGAAQSNSAGPSKGAKPFKKPISVTGTVGAGGISLIAENSGKVWKVANADALKSIEGRRVLVKAQLGPVSDELRIIVVRLNEPRSTAKLDDVAFRR